MDFVSTISLTRNLFAMYCEIGNFLKWGGCCMKSLFYYYKETGQTRKALLVGQNMVNKNPSDSDCFIAYFDYLLLLAGNEDVQIEKSY